MIAPGHREGDVTRRLVGQLLVPLVLAACSAPLAGRPPTTQASTPSQSTADETLGTPSLPVSDGVVKIGANFRYRDGLVVTVVKMQRFAIADTAAGGKTDDVGIKVTIKITNGTARTFDTESSTVDATAGPDGVQLANVFDAKHDVGNGFTTTLAPKRSATAIYGFAVPKALATKTIIIQVTPDLDHDAAQFEGRLPKAK